MHVRYGKKLIQVRSCRKHQGDGEELRRLVEKLGGIHSRIICNHANNYVSVEGDLPHEREPMLAQIDTFLKKPKSERKQHYREVGSRL